jgi:hypothetical protein
MISSSIPIVCVLSLLLVLDLCLPRPAPAQRTFGTTSEIAHVVAGSECETFDSSTNWTVDIDGNPTTGFLLRRGTGVGQVDWQAGVRLPSGAVVSRLEIAACHSNTTDLALTLYRTKLPPKTGLEQLTPAGAIATPGCGRFSLTPLAPSVIDNDNATYVIVVSTVGSAAAFDSVRVYYHLQVSPAPATATFGDVPTSHPFFQFVEALVKSGITAGCGGGNYCPDAALTRGQMAVFLSKGLGLHFAP